MTDAFAAFVQSVRATLEKNGFPAKKVSLPLERMYEVAHSKQQNFNKVLAALHESGIAHEKTNDKIIFFAQAQDMLKQAQDVLKNMPPEQLRQMEEMFKNMSDEQKAEMMQKAKDMGLL